MIFQEITWLENASIEEIEQKLPNTVSPRPLTRSLRRSALMVSAHRVKQAAYLIADDSHERGL